jgi:hypothetical protein
MENDDSICSYMYFSNRFNIMVVKNFCSGIAQLVERSTLMRKYPRSIPDEGE